VTARGAAPALAVPAVLAALLAAGCESTQDRSRRLAEGGGDAFRERGLRVGRANPDVRVVDRDVVSDSNGTAVAVVLANRGRAHARVPVAIDVVDRRGRSLFRNDAAGLDPSLTGVGLVARGDRVIWVHDEVTAAERPARVRARVGVGRERAPRRLPRLRAERVRLREETLGTAAVGFVRNASRVDQRDVAVYGVVRRGDRVVAAGRAQIRRVRAGRRARFRMYFIGDPRRGRLVLSVPPTSF
jgi:hypothetical protein